GGVAIASKLSLEAIIDRFRAYRLVDDGAGPQPVDAVFPALIVLTQEQLPGAATFATFLRDRIARRFGDLVDEETGVSIHVAQSPTIEHPVAIYMGYGVHAPDGAERGRIDVLDAQGEPLGEPLVAETTPGGIHPGQGMFAFARSERLAPAVHPDLPADAIFSLGRFPAASAARGASGLPPLNIRTAGTANSMALDAVPAALPVGSTADMRYDITGVRSGQGRVRLCMIDVTLDARPSRLRFQPPNDPFYLSVLGVAIRESFGGRKLARFWVDRTVGGILRFSGLLAENDTLVAQGTSLRPYSRADMRYLGRGNLNASLGRMSFGGERRLALATTIAPMGYISLPATPSPVVAGRGAAGEGVFALDWIGEAVTVQLASGETFRLDQLLDRMPLGLVSRDAHGMIVEPGPDIWMLADGKAVPAQRGRLKHGDRVVIGPIIAEVTAAGGSA
ncbi:MAG: hypothetical protein ACRC7C_01210, partial [Beijerinckiaceae bacterium]